MTHKQSSPIVVQAFAAPFARYPGYVISATRSRDQHVIVIVLPRPAQTDSRLVRKLAHAQHQAAPPKRRQNKVKIGQKRYQAEDRSGPALIKERNRPFPPTFAIQREREKLRYWVGFFGVLSSPLKTAFGTIGN